MASKTSWHRYQTKLRHCHHMYIKLYYSNRTRILPQWTVDQQQLQLLVQCSTINTMLVLCCSHQNIYKIRCQLHSMSYTDYQHANILQVL